MKPFKRSPRKDDVRMNWRIMAAQVRVIDSEGNQLGVLPTKEAIKKAQEVGLDLVEVAPMAKPPVCKITDYGKYKYEQKKDQKKAKQKQQHIKLHEIKFGIATDEHDIEHKLRKIKEFLAEGDKVKASVFFRGRQMMHKDLGKKVLDNVAQKLNDIATVEQTPKFEGRNLFMVFGPLKEASKGKKVEA